MKWKKKYRGKKRKKNINERSREEVKGGRRKGREGKEIETDEKEGSKESTEARERSRKYKKG